MLGQPPRRRSSTSLALGLVAAAALLPAAGCYERVVGARGLGAERIETQEPYQESGQLDRWIFGEEPADKQRARR
ncbi:MAG: hypothetical protein JNK35_02370 [Phycisphaerae bacterium]|nr:hypothetical protein [Phycisphaerae bacterium]